MSRLGWVEIEVAGVETELGLVVAVGMVGCGGYDGFSNLWCSFSNFSGFEIYRFVSGFDVCMEGLIFRDVLGLLKIDGWVWVCVLCVLNL